MTTVGQHSHEGLEGAPPQTSKGSTVRRSVYNHVKVASRLHRWEKAWCASFVKFSASPPPPATPSAHAATDESPEVATSPKVDDRVPAHAGSGVVPETGGAEGRTDPPDDEASSTDGPPLRWSSTRSEPHCCSPTPSPNVSNYSLILPS